MPSTTPRTSPAPAERRGEVGGDVAAGRRIRRQIGRVVAEARASSSFTVPLLVLSLLGWAGTLAAPLYLTSHTTLVLLAAPRPSFVIMVGHRVDFWLLLSIMVLRAMAAKPFNYTMGRRWGPKVATRVSRRSRRGAWVMAKLERAVDRWGVWFVLLRADGRVMNLVGARRLDPVKVGVAAFVNAVVHSVIFLKAAPQVARTGEAVGHFAAVAGATSYRWAVTPLGTSLLITVSSVVVGIVAIRLVRARPPAVAAAPEASLLAQSTRWRSWSASPAGPARRSAMSATVPVLP